MSTISQFTQSRLSVLLLDKRTNVLINKLPVYAEMSITVELPPYTINERLEFAEQETPIKNWLASHAFVLDAVNKIIIANVSEESFNNIADKHGFYMAIFQSIKDNLDDNSPMVEKLQVITKMVMRILKKVDIATSPQANRQALHSYPLGTLASDHAGYLSYDLRNAVLSFKSLYPEGSTPPPEISFFLFPFGKEELKIDITGQARFTPAVIFGKLSIELPADLEGIKKVNLPSMQNPGLEDWYLSPGSFAINPAFFIGADGCENLYPANFATQEFRFFQIIRGNTLLVRGETNDLTLQTPEVRAGWSLEYMVSWQPLGHTLGQIVYSLPLAPGETVKIAIIDWVRKSIDSRNEDLTVKEQLVHNTRRDRNVSETVDAAMHEWQRGGSFMGGVAGSYGGAGFGISGALGGGYSTSSGDRNVHASTVQQISDAFAQASSSVRELRSTIVIQSDQQEQSKAETRVVANHNHSHALTMLYYEVLRHYKVATQFMRVRPSILVQYADIDFNNPVNIIRYRLILESVFLEGRYTGCFDAVQKLLCYISEFERKKAQQALQPDLNDVNELGELKLVIKTKIATGRFPMILVQTKSGERIHCTVVDPLWATWQRSVHSNFTLPDAVDDGTANLVSNNYRQNGQENVFTVAPFRKVLWNDIAQIVIRVAANDLGSTTGPSVPWEIETVQIRTAQADKIWIMVNKAQTLSIAVENEILFPIDPYREIAKDPADLLTEGERCCINRLKAHLTDNAFHYKKAIWLTEDPNDRANRFKKIISNGQALIDLIDNRPLDVFGDYVAFPARKSHETSEEFDTLQNVKAEKLMTLPTRGVFAEARLGHCNASEIIDNTRFWDWQTSPITEEAPGIDNLNINESRKETPSLIPTQLPTSIVNIVTPQNLPDPTGMANAMNLLGKADIFRDMSVSKEVEDLLEKLSDNSVGIAEASNKAKEIAANRDQQSRTSNASTTPSVSAPAANLSPQQFMDWMNAVKNSGLPTQDKKDILQDVKEGAKATVNPKTPAVPKEPKTKDKRFVFQALDYQGNTIQFKMEASVFDILANKQVFKKEFIGSGSDGIIFDAADPTIKVFMVTKATNIIVPWGTLSVPQIDKQSGLIAIKDTQKIVEVTLKQLARNVSVEEKTKEEAAKTLANEYGVKLGFDKVAAAEILAKNSNQTVTTKGGETMLKFDVKLPDDSYELIVK